ncbi:MAG: DEAD/DEAH box helicase family protein [Clostridia bacterium]|nr:DEAD/DEAH box helicase family protein [Clostridia bacterium]
MFIGNLYKFQENHKNNLLKACADYRDLVLAAPTGSGKTILACSFIDDYLDENPNTVFVWLCPGAGGLEKQSELSFGEVMTGIDYGDVYSFINESNPSGKVYFINWDKINRNSNVVLREGERRNLMERVYDCHQNNIEIFMIIDEEHTYQDTAERMITDMNPGHVLRISATPLNTGDYKETVEDDEVIATGLIASHISINEGLSEAIEDNNNLDDDLMLIDLAEKKRKQIINEYNKLGKNIRPLVLIQFPNGSAEWIERVKSSLNDLGYGENSGMVTSWFSGDHPDNIDGILKNDGQYAFLLFKQAIATGWDCPRAKILIKLREGGTETFNIQTIGRIRRMPERHHYENPILDKCYVYTLDSTFKEGLTNAVSNSFYSYAYKRKFDAPNIILEKESLDGNDRYAVNPESVVKVMRNKIFEECDVNKDGVITRAKMELAKGYVFGTKLKTTAFEGVARTTRDVTRLNRIFGGEHQISNHDDGFIIRDAKRRIAAALGIDENISNNALRVLFAPMENKINLLSNEEYEFEKANKIIEDMSLREYNAFLVNNKELLIEMLNKINAKEIADIEYTQIKKEDWCIPQVQYYNQHKRIPSRRIMNKNVFKDYGNNILIKPNRSHTENVFEYWCENNTNVKWIYKNGDKGKEFFTIIYYITFRRYNFYPDYIIGTIDGKIWVIEAKGGIDSTGESKNIDKVAKNKFEALKLYAEEKGNIKWGFVRAIDQQLYISNTEWTEDMFNNNIWKPIEEIIK